MSAYHFDDLDVHRSDALRQLDEVRRYFNILVCHFKVFVAGWQTSWSLMRTAFVSCTRGLMSRESLTYASQHAGMPVVQCHKLVSYCTLIHWLKRPVGHCAAEGAAWQDIATKQHIYLRTRMRCVWRTAVPVIKPMMCAECTGGVHVVLCGQETTGISS